MITHDHKVMFSAMGFMAVVLSEVPEDKQAQRAQALAKLLESFCMSMIAEEKNYASKFKVEPAALKRMFAGLVNDNKKNQDLVADAMQALEECRMAAMMADQPETPVAPGSDATV